MEESSLLESAFNVPEYQVEPEELAEEEEPLSDREYSLLYLGHLTDTVTVGNHTIRIRTLKIGEELNAALIAHKYQDTVESGRSLATALVAACIVNVDDKPLLTTTLGPGDSGVEAKFDYILHNWYWGTIELVFKSYNNLLGEARELFDQIKKG